MDITVWIVDPLGGIIMVDRLTREYIDKYYPGGLPVTFITTEPPNDLRKPKWNFELKTWQEGYVKIPTVYELKKENEQLKKEKEIGDRALLDLSKMLLQITGGL